MNWKKLPYWIKAGILIFPILIIISIIFGLIFKTGLLFGMIVPSIIFEEMFEECCYVFSNNKIMNLVFIIFFWFLIGSLIGLIFKKVAFR